MEGYSFSVKAISIENAVFSYDKVRTILNIPAFGAQPGEKIFLHGPSGSGKTTFLGLITGVLVPDKGTVKIFNEDLGQLSARKRDQFRAERMGYIFQQFNLIPYLNTLDNILLPLWMSSHRRNKLENSSPEEEATELAKRLGLQNFLSHNVLQLSVGQQQRVAVARALIGQPELIVADEPTSALDEDRQQEFIDLLLEKTKEKNTTVLFVSHNKRLAKHFDQCVSLNEVNVPYPRTKL